MPRSILCSLLMILAASSVAAGGAVFLTYPSRSGPLNPISVKSTNSAKTSDFNNCSFIFDLLMI